jgi:hypothetical protein
MKMFSARWRPAPRLQGFLLTTFLAGGIVLLGGCDKKASLPETSATSQNSNSVAGQIPANNPGPAVGGAQVVPVTVPESTDAGAKLDQLTQLLRRFSVEHRRVPQSLNEVVAAGYLAALPPAPPGKQFAIDGKHLQVVLENK